MQYQHTETSFPNRTVIFWYEANAHWYGIKYTGTEMNQAEICIVRLVNVDKTHIGKSLLPDNLGPDPFGRMTRDSRVRVDANLTSTIKKMINAHTL